jgi:hypothetical protein
MLATGLISPAVLQSLRFQLRGRDAQEPQRRLGSEVGIHLGYFLRNGPLAAMGFQSGMILPTSLFEAFKHSLVSPLISPITRFFVSFPAVFLCGFRPGLTTGFLRNFTRNIIRKIVVD